MTEDPRISEIRAVLDEYVRPDDIDALHAIRRRIRAILDRPAPAAESDACNCQAIPGTENYPGPWHPRGDAPHYPCATSAPPAPRVFLPNDQVPVGAVITGKDGSPFRVPDVYASEGLARVGVPFVEVAVLSPEEWQAAVDRARGERETNRDG